MIEKNIGLERDKLEEYEIFKNLESLNLPPEEYVIMGSGIMYALGILPMEEIKDLDIFVNTDGWRRILFNVNPKDVDEITKEKIVLFDNSLEIFNIWETPEVTTFCSAKQNQIYIEGFPFQSLEKTLEWKKAKRREKDIEHISLIEKYLKSGGPEGDRTPDPIAASDVL